MKLIFKKFLQLYLKYITKIVLFINKPIIIAIAGSTNKTFVKNELSEMFKRKNLSFRAGQKSFNTEIGMPLSILDLPSGYYAYKKWLPIIKQAPLKIFERNFPRYLILELGVSDKKDMKYLLTIIKPDISIITDISQRYLEGFENMDSMVNEFKLLCQATDKNGLIVLNADNKKIIKLKDDLKIKNITFSIDNPSDKQAVDINRREAGESFIVMPENKVCALGKFGKHHIYAKLISLVLDENLNV